MSEKGWKPPPDDEVDVNYEGNLSKNQGSSHHVLAYRTSTPVSSSILKAADHRTRHEQLQAANADQINVLSEFHIMKTLHGKIPVSSSTLTKLRPHQQALREMTRRKPSLKKRR